MTKSTGCCVGDAQERSSGGRPGSSASAARATGSGGHSRSGSGRERRAANRGTASASGRPYCTRNPSSLLSFCFGGLLPLEAQATRSSRSITGYRARVLVIGRTLARVSHACGSAATLLRQHLHQARFADARFATEQHHLPEAVLDLRPALPQQRDFLLPAHQRRQPGGCRPLPGDCWAVLSYST